MSFPVSGRSRARRWVALVTATALATAGLLIPTAAVAAQDTLALELRVTRPAVGDDGVYRIYEGGEIEILVKATNLADFNPMMIYDMSKVHVSGVESGSIFPSRGGTPDTMSFSFSPRGFGEATLTLDAGAVYGLFDFAMSEPTSITVTVGRNATEAGTEIVRSLPVDQQARIALPAAGAGSQTVTTVSGDLPPGVTLSADGAAFEGIPTVNGTYRFSVKRASLEKVRTDSFRITVGAPASLAPSSVDVVAAVGSTATVDLGVGGDAVEASIDVSPEARPFVSLDWVDARLVLSYIVQDHDEPVSVAVTASNEFGPNATETITFRRGVVPTMNTAGSVVNLNLGENYSRTFTVTGADSVRMSQSVPGLTLERSSDAEWTVSGVAPEGEFSYKLVATNVIGSVQTADHVLRVKSAPIVTTSNELTVRTGSYTGTSLDATGFPAPTFELLSSVDDFTLTQQDGSWWLGGRGATVGTHQLRFRVWNEADSIEWVLNLTVVPGVPEILSGDQSTYRAGEDVHFQVSTRGEPTIALSFDNLPEGLAAVDRGDGTGVITGTVTTPGTYPIDIKAQNEYGEDTQTLTLTFTQRPAFTSAPLATFTKGKDGAFCVQATGFPTPELSVEGVLPEGLTFVDNGDGTASLAGTPSAAGTVKVTLIADNEPPAPMSLMARAMDPVEPVTQELTIVVADNATGTPDPAESTDPPVKPGPDAKPAPTLPATGVDGSVGMAVGGGIAALIVGLVIVAVRRRRAS